MVPGRHPAGRGLSAFGIRTLGLIAGAGALALGLGFGSIARGQLPAEIGFTTLQGEKIRLGDWRGKPALLAFWASDCPSCIAEMPELARLFKDYSGRGLQMAAVAMPYDLPNRVLSMAQAQGWPFPVALDPLGVLASALKVELVPNTYLLGRDGRVVAARLGKPDFRELRKTIEQLLREG